MDEPISYAMRNTEALNRWISFNAPGELRDWSFLAIEFILAVGVACAVRHAWRHHRENGHFSALLTLFGALLYGLLNDIVSYYTVESFWHGEFSVMLVYNRLPLYIAVLAATLLYHLCMTMRRYEFSRGVEAVATAFYGALMYMIFDNLGPMLDWWIWDRDDPTNWPFLNAVPVTSYFWFFAWTGIFAYLNRIVCWEWVEQGKGGGQLAAGVVLFPLVTCLVGIVAFLPYNLLAYNGLLGPAAALYAIAFALAGWTFVLRFRTPRVPRDPLLMVFPLLWLVGHLYLYVAKLDLYFSVDAEGLSAAGLAVGNPIVAVVAIVASFVITLVSHPTDGSVLQEEAG